MPVHPLQEFCMQPVWHAGKDVIIHMHLAHAAAAAIDQNAVLLLQTVVTVREFPRRHEELRCGEMRIKPLNVFSYHMSPAGCVGET